jgi:hypothetical protein
MSEPEKRFKCGGCEAAIFENEIMKNGNVFKIKKAVIQKRYKSNDGEWNSTHSLDINDIPKMALVLLGHFVHLLQQTGLN